MLYISHRKLSVFPIGWNPARGGGRPEVNESPRKKRRPAAFRLRPRALCRGAEVAESPCGAEHRAEVVRPQSSLFDSKCDRAESGRPSR